MNQRIRELMIQSDYPAPELALRAQKLAELIVQECANIADQDRPSYLGCGYITKTKGTLIKEHFGVEE